MGGIALALATLVEDREDMVVPFACLHACMHALYGMRSLLPVPIYTFSIRKESCVSFIFFLSFYSLYIPIVTWERGKKTVYIGVVSVWKMYIVCCAWFLEGIKPCTEMLIRFLQAFRCSVYGL